MIQILESQVKITMSLPELWIVRRVLGYSSAKNLVDALEFTPKEVEAWRSIHSAICNFLDENHKDN